MTLTQRRVRAGDPSRPDDKGATEPGIKYTCDTCHVDITHSVRIKCAHKECEEIDLCVPCFLEGKELQQHKACHPYKVVEQHSYPIFSPDWGADEELLLVSGLMKDGLGNWADAAIHIGTRTKEDCERHYLEVYLGVGPNGEDLEEQSMDTEEVESGPPRKKQKREFMPPMDLDIKVNHDEFQEKKRERIEELRRPHALPTGTPAPLVSAPTNHEVAGFMPGRLEFEHEVENEAEMPVKDMEFGLVFKYDGDKQPEAKPAVVKPADEEEEAEEEAVKDEGEEGDNAEVKEEEEEEKPSVEADGNGDETGLKEKEKKKRKGKEKAEEEEVDEAVPEQVVEIEDEDELEVKLALLDIYFSKLDKREEAKDLIFDRGLTEYKKIQANDKKRPKDERELIHRYKVFAKLQTALDYEIMVEGLIYEHNLRKRIAELQEYRRVGVTTGLEAETYDIAKAARNGFRPLPARTDALPTGARVNAGQNRFLNGVISTPPPKHGGDSREPTPRIPGHGGRKPPTPLNLANAASLDLLSWEEQQLCSSLRILPKPYLIIKELYIRENERRKGLLKRRDARKMMKIDVNKSGRIFDFLVSSGMLVLQYDPLAPPPNPNPNGNGHLGSCGLEKEKEHPTIQLGELLERPSLTEVKLNGGV